MKEQQKRKFKQIHPEIEDGIDLRRCPHNHYPSRDLRFQLLVMSIFASVEYFDILFLQIISSKLIEIF